MSQLTTIEQPTVRPHLVSRDEYYHLLETGQFDGKRVELLGGEIVEMAAQSNRHGAGVTLVARALDRIFSTGFWVRAQMTLDLSPHSMPDPDLAVIVGDPTNPGDDLPKTALLIVEVSDSTHRTDRTRKASLYAASRIADYWILNLDDAHLEVYRDPIPDAAEPFGHRYSSLTVLQVGDTVAPLVVPNATIAVSELLPG